MAKSNKNNTFGDFSKKIKLSPDRQNLKLDPPGWTQEEKLAHALADGYRMLADEEKFPPKKSIASKPDSVKLEDKLGEISTNVYARARTEVLKKMKPESRAIIEKMEREELPKDTRWDTFCKAVTIKGDQLSSLN